MVIMATSTKKRSFDATFKLEVVDYAMQNKTGVLAGSLV